MQDNILDLLSSNTTKKNGFIDHARQQQRVVSIPTTTNSTSKPPLIAPSNAHVQPNNAIFDGLDEHMSKFFMNFHKNLKDLNSTPTATGFGQQPPQQQPDFPNGFNGIHHNSFFSGFANQMLQQKQMEEQFLNLSFKQGTAEITTSFYVVSIEKNIFLFFEKYFLFQQSFNSFFSKNSGL